ncbi:hypothetical protein PLICRDRAFT_351058 [Plicaturopsis crispa FD-325 SS-3]|uniref:Uncharacterized protein n=1 Tax=Plicaturopsis crispa FD-325 SS-3 TaxID=944288 RepID=A0A0C9SKX9_PLICR|nr:hypothetical protein PLICRDRAFT_351058 [Plicaturopsis crispa FD-325 SS-3]
MSSDANSSRANAARAKGDGRSSKRVGRHWERKKEQRRLVLMMFRGPFPFNLPSQFLPLAGRSRDNGRIGMWQLQNVFPRTLSTNQSPPFNLAYRFRHISYRPFSFSPFPSALCPWILGIAPLRVPGRLKRPETNAGGDSDDDCQISDEKYGSWSPFFVRITPELSVSYEQTNILRECSATISRQTPQGVRGFSSTNFNGMNSSQCRPAFAALTVDSTDS